MRLSLQHFAAIVLTMGWTLEMTSQTPAPTSEGVPETPQAAAGHVRVREDSTDPVADPKAVVTIGNARFTVLTSELIRMEWAADGKFEDHASFVFLNRRLPAPDFSHQVTEDGKTLRPMENLQRTC